MARVFVVQENPNVNILNTIPLKTSRIDSIIQKNKIPIESINYLSLDFETLDLSILKTIELYLKNNIDYIYLRVFKIKFLYDIVDEGMIHNAIDEYMLDNFNFRRIVSFPYSDSILGYDALFFKIEDEQEQEEEK